MGSLSDISSLSETPDEEKDQPTLPESESAQRIEEEAEQIPVQRESENTAETKTIHYSFTPAKNLLSDPYVYFNIWIYLTDRDLHKDLLLVFVQNRGGWVEWSLPR